MSYPDWSDEINDAKNASDYYDDRPTRRELEADEIDEDNEDDNECPSCQGTGEGYYATRCSSCKGTGFNRKG